MDSNKKQFITSKTLAELDILCFCALSSDTLTTSLITSDSCIDTPQVKVYDPLKNLLFIYMLLNETTFGNITLDYIPKLEMPDLITDFEMETDSHLLNLKDVLAAQKSDYYNTVHSKLLRHESMAKSFSWFKICAFLAPIIGVIVLAVILYFCIKTKKLGQLVSFLTLSQNTTQALPINEKSSDYEETFDIVASIGTSFLLVFGLLYLILKYYIHFVRIHRSISLPFNECVLVKQPPSYKIALLYISSFNSYCYLYIDNVLKYPEQVVTQQLDTVIRLTFHSTLCNTYVTLNNTDITLVTKEESYKLPNGIVVPYTLRHTVRSLLASDYNVEVLIGSGSHFKTLTIQSLSKYLPLPEE